MSEYTPGPWAWRKTSNGAVLWGEHGKRPVVLDCGRTRGADQGAGQFMLRGRDAEHDLMVPLDIESADARLIEAAPNLLAQLKECVSILKVDSPCYADCMCGRCYTWKQAEAEIEKIMETKEEKDG